MSFKIDPLKQAQEVIFSRERKKPIILIIIIVNDNPL